MKFEHLRVCPLCSSKSSQKLASKGRFGEPAHVVFCNDCSLGYLNPRWDGGSYLQYYQKNYDKSYRKEIISPSLAKPIEENIAAKAILERIQTYDHTFHPDTILDIGSGDGSNLSFLRSQRFHDSRCLAIEPSDLCISALAKKNIELISQDANTNWEKETHNLDLICLRHVLEHFLWPAQILHKVWTALSEQGLVYIAVPNSLNPKGSIRNRFFRAAHTFYFNKYTLTTFLKRQGLEPAYVLEGDDYNKTELVTIAEKTDPDPRFKSYSQEIAEHQIKILRGKIKEQSGLSARLRKLRIQIQNLIK